MNHIAWGSFWILGFIWGSSFLLISIGVEAFSATQVVLIRTIIAAIGLNGVRMMRGFPLPKNWATIRALFIIGLGNTTLPFTFISLGEQNISSGMAAVLQSTASLFTLVIAHFTFSDERMSPQKIVGLIIGFVGIIILSSESINAGEIDFSIFLGQVAIVAASFCYATFTVYSRRIINKDVKPLVVSSVVFMSSVLWAILFVILEPILGGRAFVPFDKVESNALFAVLGLGFFNTFIAYLFFYFILQKLGAFRASMVTYIVPVVGLLLGWLVGEEVTRAMLGGALLIFTGIAFVNLQPEQVRHHLFRTAKVQTH